MDTLTEHDRASRNGGSSDQRVVLKHDRRSGQLRLKSRKAAKERQLVSLSTTDRDARRSAESERVQEHK
jgi:hypothetical protein